MKPNIDYHVWIILWFRYLDLLRCPLVQVDGFDPGDVDAQVAVDAGAADAHEHSEVP